MRQLPNHPSAILATSGTAVTADELIIDSHRFLRVVVSAEADGGTSSLVGLAQAGYGSGIAQAGYGSGIAQAGYGSGMAQAGYGSGMAQAGYGSTLVLRASDATMLAKLAAAVRATITTVLRAALSPHSMAVVPAAASEAVLIDVVSRFAQQHPPAKPVCDTLIRAFEALARTR